MTFIAHMPKKKVNKHTYPFLLYRDGYTLIKEKNGNKYYAMGYMRAIYNPISRKEPVIFMSKQNYETIEEKITEEENIDDNN